MQSLIRIFYTPVTNPKDLEMIDITSEEDYAICKNYIDKLTKRTKPHKNASSSLIRKLNEIQKETPEECIKTLFDDFSDMLYTKSKEAGKFLCLMVDNDLVFLYHFKPDKSINFEGNKIKEFIKYLDDSTILRLLIINKRNNTVNIWEKQKSKGFRQTLGLEYEYEEKGEIKIKTNYLEDMADIIIDTSAEDLDSDNFKDGIKLDLDEMKISIDINSSKITQIKILDKIYEIDDSVIKEDIKRHLEYAKLNISKIYDELEYYIKSWRMSNSSIIEYKDKIDLRNNGYKREILKPYDVRYKNKKTVFILDKGGISDDFNNYIVEDIIKNSTKFSIIEITNFSSIYKNLDLVDVSFFCKIHKYDDALTIAENLTQIIKNTEQNSTISKTLLYLSILTISKHFNDKLRKTIENVIIKLLSDKLTDLYNKYQKQDKPIIELKEINELGIEFKAGQLKNTNGFFDNSPQKMAEKLKKNITKKKNLNYIFYFIGFNEDTKDLSPIPLDRIRNEYHMGLKNALEQDGIKVLLSETIPIDKSKKNGVLFIIVDKSNFNQNS